MKLMLSALGLGASLLFAGCASDVDENSIDQNIGNSELNNLPRHFPTNDAHNQAGGGGGGGNLVNHGGPTIQDAHVVTLYWGSEWTTPAGANLVTSLNAYVAAYGQTGEYNTITQYSQIHKSNLAAGTATDTSTPPANVTDSALQTYVENYVNANGFDANAIYEVFLPSTSYSSDGSSTSCGGPKLAYCAYHGHFIDGQGRDVRYASMPYPGCGGCQSSGFTVAQNFEHFIAHETREAVTDADGTAWWDRRGYEADDKCAWSPAPFTDATTGHNTDATNSPFAYQYEWSNANSGCVKTK